MAFSITHPFQSGKADGVDLTLVQPSNWNASHKITIDTQMVIGRVIAGTGDATQIPISTFGVPTGAMMAFAKTGDTPPSGWVMCDGHEENRTTQAALFAVIGTTYGVGDGSTTFNVPDLRGRLPYGRDNMGGSIAGVLTVSGSNATGTKFGNENHTHTVTVNGSGTGSTSPGVSDIPTGPIFGASAGAGIYNDNSHVHNIPALSVTVAVTATGTTSNQSALPPGMITNWIIKL